MKPSTSKWVLLLVAGAIGSAAVWSAGPTDDLRRENDLVMPPVPETVRPSMFLSPMLALGRAPIVDYLWLRATKLKEEGRYFDAYQLSEMICELQPKFAAVWAFHGWNMAYNISVTLKSPEERWRWVRNGYELIRDRGIPLNPNNTQLYRELAWILFHKVGDYMDEWHAYYKLQFALEMEDILGPPPPEFVRDGRVRGDYYREYDYQPLADAPESIDELAADAGVAALIGPLRKFGFDASAPGVYLNLLAALRDGTVRIGDANEAEQANQRVALEQLMSDERTAAARTALEHYWRATRLRSEVKLDPRRILAIEKGFGAKLDYRLPEAQALYWANMGIEKGTDRHAFVDIHRLNTNRIEFFCLDKMFKRGRLSMSRNAHLGEPPLMAPDLRMIPILFDAYVRDSESYLAEEQHDNPVSINFETGFIGFMRTAIIRYHELGINDEAGKMFDYLAEHYPDPMYARGLDGFLARQFEADRDETDLVKATARIEALLKRAIMAYAFNDDEQAAQLIVRARDVYDVYKKNLVSKRMAIPREFPELMQEIVERIGPRLYRGTYESLRRKLNLPPIEDAASSQPNVN